LAQPLNYRALATGGEKQVTGDSVLGVQRMHEAAATAEQVSILALCTRTQLSRSLFRE
jgi:hypothetical protein